MLWGGEEALCWGLLAAAKEPGRHETPKPPVLGVTQHQCAWGARKA